MSVQLCPGLKYHAHFIDDYKNINQTPSAYANLMRPQTLQHMSKNSIMSLITNDQITNTTITKTMTKQPSANVHNIEI